MQPTPNPESLPGRLADDLDGAFADVVRVYQDGIYSGAVQLTRDRHDAEDVVQETFVRAYRALQRYPARRRAELRLGGWLWTIALDVCRNRHRARSRRPDETTLAVLVDPSDPAADDPAAVLDGAAEIEEWRRRLADLPEPQRNAVVLRHVVGLGYDEIAAATGRPVGTVKADVHRGIRRLERIPTVEEVTS
ncbi:MAG TPA: sigma-70 family RNA polymerase sigma factor [Actinobacteria bacterium]|nr:sigma-70 family RNA polymerase sigma factor [Actinomycetota bacterium]